MTSQWREKLIAVVDDDESLRLALKGLLKEAGLPVHLFASAEDFLNAEQRSTTGCLIADIRMPGMSGLDLQAKLKADRWTIPIIFITAHGDERLRLQAMRAGAVDFLTKPFDDRILLEKVRLALEVEN
jgi:FixJ family two-component response regulator